MVIDVVTMSQIRYSQRSGLYLGEARDLANHQQTSPSAQVNGAIEGLNSEEWISSVHYDPWIAIHGLLTIVRAMYCVIVIARP